MITLFDLRKRQDEALIIKISQAFEDTIKVRSLDEDIKTCIGCWSCWVKTPGKCVHKDVMTDFYQDYIKSDKVILLLDTNQGFINHVGKTFLDRTIPHYLPYIELVDKECHHYARYDTYPDLYFYYDHEHLTVAEEKVIEDYLYRTAYHFQSEPYRLIEDDTIVVEKLLERNARNRQIKRQSQDKIDRLVIYNGSPRRKGSNTAMILEHIQSFYNDIEVRDLKEIHHHDAWAESFKEDSHVLFMLPLYVHAMPGHVMAFIEKLQASPGSIGFIVQSGFPEASQSYYLEAYFELLSQRLEREYLGTAIKGGVEGLQIRPPKQQEKMMQSFVNIMDGLLNDGRMRDHDIEKMAIPKRLSNKAILLYKVLEKTNLIHFFWNKQLKDNQAFENRYARPYY